MNAALKDTRMCRYILGALPCPTTARGESCPFAHRRSDLVSKRVRRALRRQRRIKLFAKAERDSAIREADEAGFVLL